MPEKTEAQKRAQKKYMSSFVEIKVRMTPERRSIIQNHARAMGESVTVFINRAISETMERDGGRTPPEAAQQALEGPPMGKVVSLPSETAKSAQRAAKAAGEALPDFLARAVETQAQRDAMYRRMKGGKSNE